MLSIFPAHDSFQLLSTNNQIIGAIMLDKKLLLKKKKKEKETPPLRGMMLGVVSYPPGPLHFPIC